MNINRQNYETILIDYLDGNLSHSEAADLALFLAKNPDIAEELEGLQQAFARPKTIQYSQKNHLKKSNGYSLGVNSDIDYLCIAELENDINASEKIILSEHLKSNENACHIQTIFSNTKLSIPHSISYPYKSTLKRLPIVQVRKSTFRTAASIAASIAIILATYTSINLNSTQSLISNVNSPLNSSEYSKNQQVTALNHESAKPIPENDLTVKKIERKVNKNKANPEKSTPAKTQEHAVIKMEPIKSVHIGNQQIALAKIDLSPKSINLTSPENAQPMGTTKEYTIADLAQEGLKRAASALGIKYNIKKNNDGKIEKLSIESNLLAFSTTKGKKDE